MATVTTYCNMYTKRSQMLKIKNLTESYGITVVLFTWKWIAAAAHWSCKCLTFSIRQSLMLSPTKCTWSHFTRSIVTHCYLTHLSAQNELKIAGDKTTRIQVNFIVIILLIFKNSQTEFCIYYFLHHECFTPITFSLFG